MIRRVNVLLTGAFGTVGRHALAELLKAGHAVRALELPTPRNQAASRELAAPRLEMAWVDVRDELAVTRAMEGQEAVAHLAAIIPPLSDQQPELARAVNVDGTRNVLQAMKRAGARRLVYTSSVAVFARAQPRPPPRRADDPTAGTDPYSHHKLECEALVRASGLDACILRFGAVMPTSTPDLAFQEQLRMVFEIPLDQRIETVDARDAGLAVANAVRSPEVGGKTLLVGGGAGSQLHFRELISTMLGARGLRMFPDEAFGSEPYHTEWMDTAEAQRLLHFQRHSWGGLRGGLPQGACPRSRADEALRLAPHALPVAVLAGVAEALAGAHFPEGCVEYFRIARKTSGTAPLFAWLTRNLGTEPPGSVNR